MFVGILIVAHNESNQGLLRVLAQDFEMCLPDEC